jgi:hypothetical protein
LQPLQKNFHAALENEKGQIEIGAFFKQDGAFFPGGNRNVRQEFLDKIVVLLFLKQLILFELGRRQPIGNF